MKGFVQAACVAGAVIFSAAGCCSSCGSKNTAPAAATPYSTPVVTKSGMPTAAPASGYGAYAGKGSPQMISPTVQTGTATVTGEMPSGFKMPGN
jgi:hypothetical protein